jgi:predicted nucleic acid-binding protein
MKVVVADTSPLNYLVLIDCIDLLRGLYAHIVIPMEVFNELTVPDAPPQVAAWIRSQPSWIEVRAAPPSIPLQLAANEPRLDPGEYAAIQLALIEQGSLLLIDEAAGRLVAARLGIATTGTLGVLVAGARAGMIALQVSLDRLRSTNFRVSQSLIDKLLADASAP